MVCVYSEFQWSAVVCLCRVMNELEKKNLPKKNKKQTRIQSVFLLTITVKLSFKKQKTKKQ